MKNILIIILILILTGSVHADTFFVGQKELEIPSPPGFSRVTQQMKEVYRLSQQMADPVNEQLAYYIAESDIPVAMSGKIPALERYYVLKINKELKDMVVGSKDFAKFKSITNRQNKEILKSIESKIPGLMEKTSKGISKEYDINFALQVSQMIPLDPHYETDNTFAYSMYINYGASVDGSKEDFIVSATATFVNVAGKLLFLYCYGPQNDLEWTRNASKAWAGMVTTSNFPPPSRSAGSGGIDWGRVFDKAISGAIIGGLIALIFGIFSRFKKKG